MGSRVMNSRPLSKPMFMTLPGRAMMIKPRLILSPSQQQGLKSMSCMERYILRSKSPVPAKDCPWATRSKSDLEPEIAKYNHVARRYEMKPHLGRGNLTVYQRQFSTMVHPWKPSRTELIL